MYHVAVTYCHFRVPLPWRRVCVSDSLPYRIGLAVAISPWRRVSVSDSLPYRIGLAVAISLWRRVSVSDCLPYRIGLAVAISPWRRVSVSDCLPYRVVLLLSRFLDSAELFNSFSNFGHVRALQTTTSVV
jgi:hypothetical protein